MNGGRSYKRTKAARKVPGTNAPCPVCSAPPVRRPRSGPTPLQCCCVWPLICHAALHGGPRQHLRHAQPTHHATRTQAHIHPGDPCHKPLSRLHRLWIGLWHLQRRACRHQPAAQGLNSPARRQAFTVAHAPTEAGTDFSQGKGEGCLPQSHAIRRFRGAVWRPRESERG